MKARSNWKWMLGVLALPTLVMSGLAAAFVEETMSLDQVPQAARQELEKHAGSAKIRQVEAERHNGVMVYEAEWRVNGTEHEACVTADGALVEIEESIPAERAPAGVRAAIAQHFGANAKVSVEQKMVVFFEVEGKVNGKHQEVLVSPTGRVHEEADDEEDEGDEGEDDDEKDDDAP